MSQSTELFRQILQIRDSLTNWLDQRLPYFIFILALALLPSYRFFSLETLVYDIQIKSRFLLAQHGPSRLPDPISIVLIDDDSIRLDEKGLLIKSNHTSREYIADVIACLVKQNPKVIALDILLDFPADEECRNADVKLQKTLRDAMRYKIPVVLTSRLRNLGNVVTCILPIPLYLESGEIASNLLTVGYANLVTSALDGIVRESSYGTLLARETIQVNQLFSKISSNDRRHYYLTEGSVYALSFALQIVRAIDPSLCGHDNDLINRHLDTPYFYIDFSQRQGEINTYSAGVLLSTDNSVSLEGSIVLIGVGTNDTSDVHNTPLSTPSILSNTVSLFGKIKEPIVGVQIQAVILRSMITQMRSDTRIIVTRLWPLLIGIVLLIFLEYYIVIVCKKSALGVLFFTFSCAYIVASFLLFQWRLIYIPVVKPISLYLVGILGIRYIQKVSVHPRDKIE